MLRRTQITSEKWRCLTVFIYCACRRIEKLKRSSDFVRIRELSVKSDFARPALFTPLGFASEIHCLTLPRFCKSSYGKSRKKRTAHIVSNLLCVQPLSAFPDFSPSFFLAKAQREESPIPTMTPSDPEIQVFFQEKWINLECNRHQRLVHRPSSGPMFSH